MNADFVTNKIFDQLSRSFEYLRISVTDRCNYRCNYCMPSDIFNKNYKYISHSNILSYEEIIYISKLLQRIGLKKIRITGGEPLLRRNIDKLVYKLKYEAGIENISMTTNGSLLSEDKILSLKKSGLDSITLSLDTLIPEKIKSLNGFNKHINITELLENIEKYFGMIKTNTVVIKGINDNEIMNIVERMKNMNAEIRFIEYMDVGESNDWHLSKVMPSSDILCMLKKAYDIKKINTEKSSTSKLWKILSTNTRVGFISSITEPFCHNCNRARLSVDGKIYTCLFANEGFDIREMVRSKANEDELIDYFTNKWKHRNDRYSELRFFKKTDLPKVEMSYIGG